ncbi:(d)CMP kinase [Frankia sp. AgB1.9]|nr:MULTISPECIES: ATP-binding protein [unclassified Frankia]MBL7490423.1 (d)CMP kinase [Frankia sp. AgW1.1]MBL7550059.1 (d)CMP kinase [Frankia sp. AgB1.9]MBL7624630.1 (d)CMP kinase [Frankia sp. AgB1.8]
MTRLRPFSDHQRGLFITIDGPSGAGKSTLVRHLAQLLVADPEVIARRVVERGAHNRFQLAPGSSHAEAHFYRQATDRLLQAGFDVLRIDCGARPPERLAEAIRDRLMAFFAAPAIETPA